MDSHNLSNITKLEKKKHYSGDKFCGTSFDENLGKDVLFSEVLFLQQTCHFCLVKCGDFR
jgi:hypothetical protein